MKEQGKPLIQVIFLCVLWLSIIITVLGGVYYLSQHGQEILSYQEYKKEPTPLSPQMIWKKAVDGSATGLIMAGILTLLISQLVRVALIAWYYAHLREIKFVGFSLFLLGILVYSLFWNT